MPVESCRTKQALSEAQSQNQYLQEQVGMQRQVLKEMEQQLQLSEKSAAQLRAQVRDHVCAQEAGIAARKLIKAPAAAKNSQCLPSPGDSFALFVSMPLSPSWRLSLRHSALLRFILTAVL